MKVFALSIPNPNKGRGRRGSLGSLWLVIYFKKAFGVGDFLKLIYRSGIAMVGVDALDCITVGDSLHHDIKGVNTAGIESVFITGGIHAFEPCLSSFGEVAGILLYTWVHSQ